jgi:CheY-like chemotaxis protein
MKSILLVEDESFIVQMYQSKLESSGFSVYPCESVALAEKVLYSDGKSIDLILLDLILPEKGGMEFLAELKEQEMYKDIPVIILSNLSAQQDIDQALKFGAVDYIVKSNFTPVEVVQIVNKYLNS